MSGTQRTPKGKRMSHEAWTHRIKSFMPELYRALLNSEKWDRLTTVQTEAFERAAPEIYKHCVIKLRPATATFAYYVVLFREQRNKPDQKLDSMTQRELITEVQILDSTFRLIERVPVVERIDARTIKTEFCGPYLKAFEEIHKKYCT